jgi:hypothetical protein
VHNGISAVGDHSLNEVREGEIRPGTPYRRRLHSSICSVGRYFARELGTKSAADEMITVHARDDRD